MFEQESQPDSAEQAKNRPQEQGALGLWERGALRHLGRFDDLNVREGAIERRDACLVQALEHSGIDRAVGVELTLQKRMLHSEFLEIESGLLLAIGFSLERCFPGTSGGIIRLDGAHNI